MPEKKNVLFIITDAHRADYMSCAGHPILKTPNLDRLASDGVRFTNHFCTNPMCLPNRASMVTGMYPNVHGVRSNGINLNQEMPTIIQTLRKRGWHTAAMGKIHHQYWIAPFKMKYRSAEDIVSWSAAKKTRDPVKEHFPIPYYGYNEVELVIGNGSVCSGHYMDWLEERSSDYAKRVKKQCLNYDYLFSLFCDEIPEELYNTTYVKERTIAFLDRFVNGDYGSKPFYLHCSFPDPHYPIYPAERIQNQYKPENVILPSNFNDIKRLRNHTYLGPILRNPVFKNALVRETTEEEAKKFIALTYASIAMVDESIGQILAYLEKQGLADNTIVVYMSDHGDFMGEHGLLFKGPCPFNGQLHIPMIWRIPNLTNGGVSEALISSIDYPQTILHLLDIPTRHHPPDMQSLDITPILKDTSKSVRDACYIEHDEEVGPLKSRIRHLITNEYKLTIYEGYEGYGDLYDRKNDPDEIYNLWNNKDYQDVRHFMVDKLLHESLKALRRYPKRIAGS
ncbi:MAG: sulfatase family protein [Promethearchaeota archaeon]